MDDEIKTLDDLRRAFLGIDLRRDPLDGFDPDIVGFNCAAYIEAGEPVRCPFEPGCGRLPGPQCELMLQRARMLLAIPSQ